MAAPKEFEVAILDTNVLDYGFKAPTKYLIAELLQTVSQRYTLVISEFLRFEIYRGLEMQRISSAKQLVDAFTAYAVDKNVLDIAAALSTCYAKDKATHTKHKGIGDGDIILAATAFAHRLLVVTANRMDFPAPYFEEVGVYRYTDKKSVPRVFYTLKPQILYLNSMLDICYPSAS